MAVKPNAQVLRSLPKIVTSLPHLLAVLREQEQRTDAKRRAERSIRPADAA